jgi:hypothetical protein
MFRRSDSVDRRYNQRMAATAEEVAAVFVRNSTNL